MFTKLEKRFPTWRFWIKLEPFDEQGRLVIRAKARMKSWSELTEEFQPTEHSYSELVVPKANLEMQIISACEGLFDSMNG